MQFTFLDMTGKTLFIRDDAERAQWTQEEMTLNLEFPYHKDKVIEINQRIYFKDPADGTDQIYEVRQAKTYEPDSYQQIVAEHICISELSDEHIDNIEMYGVPPQTALQTVLGGTQWSVGEVHVGDLAAQEQLRAEIRRLGLNGNVDLTSRPIIYPDKMKAAGYTDFDGDYATLYSTTYTVNNAADMPVTLLMTPIQQNGYVFSYEELDNYVDALCKQSFQLEDFRRYDDCGLLMHFLFDTQIAEMDAIAEQAHNLSDEWETLNVGVLSSADLSRGCVWQAVLEIKDSWNVYITPRVSLSATGEITRKLDINHTSGEYRGLRLSVDKNMLDPSVTFDDSDIVTALYGYGGTVQGKKAQDKDVDIDFADIVWQAEDGHPAKPRGQKYIEDPAATLEYGRNGRARFGFYQNTDITDPEILLQKTWESLQANSKPAISIEGTVADLYRMGYADVPIKLHDIAIVEVLPAGYKDQIQIIRITTDLLDPSATTLTIGAYIPNIVYLQKKTNESATGSRGGGGKNTSTENQWKEFRTTIESYEDGTGLKIRSVQNDLDNTKEEVAIQEAQIEVCFNKITQEVTDRRDADAVLQGRITVEANRITEEVTKREQGDEVLSSRITIEADRITQEVNDRTNQGNALSSKITQTASQIRSEVSDTANGLQSSITQTASQIRSEVSDTANGLQSSITQTASQIRSEVSDTANGLSSSITQTASQIRSEVNDSVNGLQSSITQTASQIRSEVSDTANGLQSSITQTASQIRSEVRATENDLHSSITQTASQIRSEVSDAVNGLSSSIEQTDIQIRTEVGDALNYMNSSITQTASQIRSEVSSSVNGLSSSITQTASQIRTEVSDSINGVNSSITQTASQIRSEVSNSVNGLSSSITQNSDKIALVVDSNNNIKAASIVASINNEQSSVVISADHINLDGYVTASQLNTQKARIDNMLSGDATFSYMVATSAYLGNANSTNVKIYNQTVRVYSVKDTNGTTRQVFGYTLS